MKVECVKETVQKAISVAEKINGRNLSLPILSCVLLSVEDKQFKIRATNLDLGVEFVVPAKIIEKGTVAVPGVLLNNYLSGVQSRTITFELIEGTLQISSATGKTKIKVLNHEDFPIIPQVPTDLTFLLPSADLALGIKAVWYAASPSSIKPELSSVYIYAHDGHLVFVATDSFRLAEKKIPMKINKTFPPLLIPFKNIPEILRCIETIGSVTIAVTKNQISISADNFYLTSRVVEGLFPDYKQIIPKNAVTEATVLKEDIVNALHLANIFTDKFNQVSFGVHPKNKLFELKSRNAETGESVEKVHASLSGEDLDINFNYRYIADAFQSIQSDSVTFAFSGMQKPLIMRGTTDTSFLYLVMPMNR